MLRKMMIALIAVTFTSGMAALSTADARMGGGFGGGGFHGGMGGGFGGGGFRGGMGGGFGGGGFRGGMAGFRGGFGGGGFRGGMVGFRGGFVGSRGFAFHNRGFFGPGFGFHNRFFGPRFAFRNRFFGPGLAFAAVPFGIGWGLYGGSCWSWQPLPWGGWQRVWACGYGYDYY